MVQRLGDIHNYKIVMRVNEEPHQTAQTERLNSYMLHNEQLLRSAGYFKQVFPSKWIPIRALKTCS